MPVYESSDIKWMQAEYSQFESFDAGKFSKWLLDGITDWEVLCKREQAFAPLRTQFVEGDDIEFQIARMYENMPAQIRKNFLEGLSRAFAHVRADEWGFLIYDILQDIASRIGEIMPLKSMVERFIGSDFLARAPSQEKDLFLIHGFLAIAKAAEHADEEKHDLAVGLAQDLGNMPFLPDSVIRSPRLPPWVRGAWVLKGINAPGR